MVNIDVSGFAGRIRNYLESPERFSQEAVVDTLDLVDPQSRFGKRKGITFGYNTKLVMDLLARAYYLSNGNDKPSFSDRVAHAIQNFATPFPERDNLCYPHFLFHGLVQPNIDDVIAKIESNSRIIHETLNNRDEIMKEHGSVALEGGLQLAMDHGVTDDYFGIAYLLAKDDAILLSSSYGYIAKTSFFVDKTIGDVYVMTIQGRGFDSHNPVRTSHLSEKEKSLEAEREYGRIGNVIGMGPRRFTLQKVMDFGRGNGFRRIRVIKPEEHPMFIERHKGFLANYESVIKKAGIKDDNGCYLERVL